MFDYTALLKKNPKGVFVTKDREKSKSHVLQYQFSDGNKVYFFNSNEKSASNHLKKNAMILFVLILQLSSCFFGDRI